MSAITLQEIAKPHNTRWIEGKLPDAAIELLSTDYVQ